MSHWSANTRLTGSAACCSRLRSFSTGRDSRSRSTTIRRRPPASPTIRRSRPPRWAEHCDLAVVVGGDGTMLGIARQLAGYSVPLVGINQGRLGFITDVPINAFETALAPMIDGDYVEERRTMLAGSVWRDGEVIFEGFAVNDVVVSRGGTSSMVELKIDIGDEFVANIRVRRPDPRCAHGIHRLRAVRRRADPASGHRRLGDGADRAARPVEPADRAARSGETSIEIVAGRDASVNFDMQSLASLLHGDRVTVRRSPHQVRFLHPLGWSYYATLRRKLHWNSGVN